MAQVITILFLGALIASIVGMDSLSKVLSVVAGMALLTLVLLAFGSVVFGLLGSLFSGLGGAGPWILGFAALALLVYFPIPTILLVIGGFVYFYKQAADEEKQKDLERERRHQEECEKKAEKQRLDEEKELKRIERNRKRREARERAKLGNIEERGTDQ